MRRRRSAIATDSLDLLLDTITNTFGGILLLALLLVLLVRDENDPASERSSTNTSVEHKQALEKRAEELIAQRDVLRQSVKAQSIADFGQDQAETKQLMNELSRLIEHIASVKADQANEETKSREIDAKIRQLAAQVANSKFALSQAEAELAKVEEELEKEKALRTRTMDLPRERITSKRMTVVILKANRMYILDTSFGAGTFTYNGDHFAPVNVTGADVVLADGTALAVRPENGVDLQTDLIDKRLARLDPSLTYLTIVVPNDSFEGFAKLRAACVNLGVEYSIFLAEQFPVVEGRANEAPTAQ